MNSKNNNNNNNNNLIIKNKVKCSLLIMIKQLLVIYQLLAGSAKKIQHSSWVRYLPNPRWLGHICFVITFVFLESSLSSLFTSHKCLLLSRLKHQDTAWMAVNMPCLFVNFSKTWHWVSENLLYNILRVYCDPHADVNYRYLSANQKRIGSWKKKDSFVSLVTNLKNNHNICKQWWLYHSFNNMSWKKVLKKRGIHVTSDWKLS